MSSLPFSITSTVLLMCVLPVNCWSPQATLTLEMAVIRAAPFVCGGKRRVPILRRRLRIRTSASVRREIWRQAPRKDPPPVATPEISVIPQPLSVPCASPKVALRLWPLHVALVFDSTLQPCMSALGAPLLVMPRALPLPTRGRAGGKIEPST